MGIKYQFQGYNTKPDKMLGDGSIASDCNNVIINRGNLCNVPMSERKLVAGIWQYADEVLVAFYFYRIRIISDTKEISALIAFGRDGLIYISNYAFDSTRTDEITRAFKINDFGDAGQILKMRYPYDLNDSRQYSSVLLNTLSGNILQVNDWVFFLCQTGEEVPSQVTPTTPKVYPQMLRLRFPAFDQQNILSSDDEYEYIFSLIGLYQPSEIQRVTVGNPGNVTGLGMDFGFSFSLVHTEENRPAGTDIEQIESNVTISNQVASYSNQYATFKIYLPAGHGTYWSSGKMYINFYTRTQTQSIYYYSGRIQTNGSRVLLDGNRRYVTITVGVTNLEGALLENQDLTRPAPMTSLTPIVGAHDPPKIATHGCYFKGKMYYNCLEFKNLLQISASTPPGKFDTGLYANYIERWEFVGKESSSINGLIEYQRQLIIFQDVETYVLTDNIESGGELGILFHDLGCVKGGKAYIIFDEKLAFGSRRGIYVYNGSSEPLLVSDAIQKDLEKISRVRYEYMRLAVDSEHKLLFVNFPLGKGCNVSEQVPTFVFHYAEGGKWTKIDPISDTLNDIFCNQEPNKQFNMLYNGRSGLRLIKSVDDATVTYGTTEWQWTSSIFDLKDVERFKHWLWMRLGTIPDLALHFQIIVEFFDGQGNVLGGGGLDIVDLDMKKFRRISAHAKTLIVKLSGITKKPFRLTEFEIEGHTRTKR